MNIEDICFIDTETRSLDGETANVKDDGTYRYAKNSFVIILTYAIGEQPVKLVELDWRVWGKEKISFDDLPRENADIVEHAYRAADGEAWFGAWNAGFDRQAWNNSSLLHPKLLPEHCIDIMAQAVASNLPPNLEGASRFIGRGGKQDDGKALIKLFCSDGGGTPQTHPVEWARFKSYAIRDTAELREVFRHTRPLPMDEWEEYWASEHINDRGKEIDLDFVRKAAAVAKVDARRTNELLARYTNGQITKVTQHQRLADWVWDSLSYSDARELLISEYDDEHEQDIVTVKLSLERSRVSKLITFFEAMEQREGELCERDRILLHVLQLREFGASAAPKKFDKMLAVHDDGVLKGGYVWNGAAQTGRFSSKGVQEHNLTRSVIGRKGALEPEAIEMINELEV